MKTVYLLWKWTQFLWIFRLMKLNISDHTNPPFVFIVAQLLSCANCFATTQRSPPGSSVHDILQTRILEWVAISSFRVSSQPRDWTRVSCIVRWFLYTEPPGKLYLWKTSNIYKIPNRVSGWKYETFPNGSTHELA